MAVFKEAYYGLQQIADNSRTIYTDAADYGVPCEPGSKFWNLAKSLADIYGDPATRRVDRYETGVTASIDLDLIDEFGSGREERYRLTFVSSTSKSTKSYLSVEPIKPSAPRPSAKVIQMPGAGFRTHGKPPCLGCGRIGCPNEGECQR